MIKYYWQFYIRNLIKNKGFGLLNIGGLAIGMASFIYILDYVHFESGFDKFHEDYDRIYRVTSQKIQDGQSENRKSSASVALAPYLAESFDEIEAVATVHIFDIERQIVIIDKNGTDEKFEETGVFHADDGYFNIFSDQLLYGNPGSALKDPFSMVITESLAKKYFGKTDVIGEVIALIDEDRRDYKITGVVADNKPNQHFKYDMLISLATMKTLWHYARWNSWDWDYFHTYIKMKPGIEQDDLTDKINHSVAMHGREAFKERNFSMDYQLQNIADIHLTSNLGRELSQNGDGSLLNYLKVVAIFILVLAWINYINLNTATAIKRAKEIGVRKVVGASKQKLINQLLFESGVSNVIALGFSILLLWTFSGSMQKVTSHIFGFNIFTDPAYAALFSVIIISGSLISGFYPALIMARYKPALVLKGTFSKSNKGEKLRRTLILFQYVISIVLVTLTCCIYYQVQFLQNRNLGINLDQVLAIHTPNVRSDQFWQEYELLNAEFKRNAAVKNVSASNQIPGNTLYHVELFKLKEQNITESRVMKMIWIDYDFNDLYNLKLLAGRDFDRNINGDERGLIVNNAAARLLGFNDLEQAVNQPVTWVHSYGELDEMKIIGVVNDFDQKALGSSEPMVFLMNRFFRWKEMQYYLVEMESTNPSETIAHLEQTFETIYPNEVFRYYFLDKKFASAYELQARFNSVFGIFSLIAIVISNLGLFGLTTFMISSRKKEISIRKVLGASMGNIIQLFSFRFMIQISIAIAIGLPISVYAINLWLDQFIYRMELHVWLFLIPVVLTSVVAAITVGMQVIPASVINPAHNLRNE